MTADVPTAQELWEQAKREHPLTDEDRANGVVLSSAQSGRFRALMRAHGKPLFSEVLMRACGVPEQQIAVALGDVDHPDEMRSTPNEARP